MRLTTGRKRDGNKCLTVTRQNATASTTRADIVRDIIRMHHVIVMTTHVVDKQVRTTAKIYFAQAFFSACFVL
jgi:hypothetical protein